MLEFTLFSNYFQNDDLELKAKEYDKFMRHAKVKRIGMKYLELKCLGCVLIIVTLLGYDVETNYI